jgi:thioredoxin-dependent peroxiredoxin
MKRRKLYIPFFLILSGIITEGQLPAQETTEKLKVGSAIPEFSLRDQDGNVFDIRSVVGKENLVIFFYVKDETPGCTTEACTFRDQYDAFRQADARVIGISSQSVDSHRDFAGKYKLQYTLLSDPDDSVRKMFGVKAGPFPGRVTFVVDKTGKVVYIFNSQTQPAKHVSEAIRILKNIG